jgi:hypothetical protein
MVLGQEPKWKNSFVCSSRNTHKGSANSLGHLCCFGTVSRERWPPMETLGSLSAQVPGKKDLDWPLPMTVCQASGQLGSHEDSLVKPGTS